MKQNDGTDDKAKVSDISRFPAGVGSRWSVFALRTDRHLVLPRSGPLATHSKLLTASSQQKIEPKMCQSSELGN